MNSVLTTQRAHGFPDDLVQPKHHYAIVDEVDSVLIDDEEPIDHFRAYSRGRSTRI